MRFVANILIALAVLFPRGASLAQGPPPPPSGSAAVPSVRSASQAPGSREPSPEDPAPGAVASVRFTSPSPSEVAWGPTLLRAAVAAPRGVAIVRVDFFVDGVLVGSDPAAPYEVRWEAGREMESRVLRAVARLSDGTQASDLRTTRGLRFRSYDVVEGSPIERVSLLVSVTDEQGRAVPGLAADDFRILDAGRSVRPDELSVLGEREDQPLSVAVLVDQSGSMQYQMKAWRDACLQLLAGLRPIDQVRVAAFSEEMVVLQDFTRDAEALGSSLDGIGPGIGGTRLYRAVLDTVRDLRGRPGRKALILLTDGLDTEFSSPSGTVTASMSAILTEAARMASQAGVTVVLILPGPTGRGYLAVQDLALQTGGWWMYPGKDLRSTLRRLGERLLTSYLLAYDTERPKDPLRKRPVKVTLRDDRGGRWSLRAALSAWAAPGVLEALRDDLRNGSAPQRARAAFEIARLEDPRGAPLLVEALDDEAPQVRAAAVAALGEARIPEALEEVVRRIRDPDPSVRAAAFEAAVRYGEVSAPALAKEAKRRGVSRVPAREALAQIHAQTVETAGGAAREEALARLVALGGAEAETALRRLLVAASASVPADEAWCGRLEAALELVAMREAPDR